MEKSNYKEWYSSNFYFKTTDTIRRSSSNWDIYIIQVLIRGKIKGYIIKRMEKKVVASLMVMVVVMSDFVAAENDGFEQSNPYLSHPAIEFGRGFYKMPAANEYHHAVNEWETCHRVTDSIPTLVVRIVISLCDKFVISLCDKFVIKFMW